MEFFGSNLRHLPWCPETGPKEKHLVQSGYLEVSFHHGMPDLTSSCLLIFCQVRYKLGLSDDEEDEEDEDELPRSDHDLCHPLCQCDKCSKWQKVRSCDWTHLNLETALRDDT